MVEAGEYRDKVESVRVPKNCPDEYLKTLDQCGYWKMEESGRVPGKGRIRASTKKLFGQEPKNARINVNTEKW